MQLDIGLNKVFLPLISDLKKEQIKQEININNGIATIASIQNHYLNYRLGNLRPFKSRYSKQAISISNINFLILQTITAVANKHNNLVISSIIGKFDNDFNLSFDFKGSIYE